MCRRLPGWTAAGLRVIVVLVRGLALVLMALVVTASSTGASAHGRAGSQCLGLERPTWSPDGTRLAVVESRLDTDRLPLFALDLKASPPRKHLIARDSGRQPAWSPRGDVIAVYDGIGIALVDVERGSRKRIPGARGSEPSWSPDGRRLAYEALGPIAISRPDGSRKQFITERNAARERSDRVPAWSPDGRTILFHREESVGARVLRAGLMAVGSNGRNPRWIKIEGGSPSWAPGGDAIAYQSGLHLETARLDGSRRRILARGSANEPPWAPRYPAWSPMGDRIAFVREDCTLWTTAPDGSATRRVM